MQECQVEQVWAVYKNQLLSKEIERIGVCGGDTKVVDS
jgi:hypothetical protein